MIMRKAALSDELHANNATTSWQHWLQISYRKWRERSIGAALGGVDFLNDFDLAVYTARSDYK